VVGVGVANVAGQLRSLFGLFLQAITAMNLAAPFAFRTWQELSLVGKQSSAVAQRTGHVASAFLLTAAAFQSYATV
jgi:hypothetical protein